MEPVEGSTSAKNETDAATNDISGEAAREGKPVEIERAARVELQEATAMKDVGSEAAQESGLIATAPSSMNAGRVVLIKQEVGDKRAVPASESWAFIAVAGTALARSTSKRPAQ